MKGKNENFEMANEDDFEQISADINQNLIKIRETTDQFFKRKLIMFYIRWGITFVLLYLFLNQLPWLKYLMYVAIPLGLLNLVLIFIGRKKLNEKLAETENKINSF